jgi:hypothetical protein
MGWASDRRECPGQSVSPRVALVTCKELPDFDEDTRRLIAPLAARGIAATAAVWDDPEVVTSSSRRGRPSCHSQSSPDVCTRAAHDEDPRRPGASLDRLGSSGRVQPSMIHETMCFQISITAPSQVDSEVRKCLQQAYGQNC